VCVRACVRVLFTAIKLLHALTHIYIIDVVCEKSRFKWVTEQDNCTVVELYADSASFSVQRMHGILCVFSYSFRFHTLTSSIGCFTKPLIQIAEIETGLTRFCELIDGYLYLTMQSGLRISF
jgi:hypothetical protein